VKKWFLSAAVAAALISLAATSLASPQEEAAPPAGRGRGRGAPRRGPGGPVPLLSDGKPDLSGVWNGQQIVAATGDVAATGPGSAGQAPPMLPWAVKVQADRAKTLFADDFEARCLPGGPRGSRLITCRCSRPRSWC
jgi:hypothetical protein